MRERHIVGAKLITLDRLKRRASFLSPGSLARRLILEEPDAVEPDAWLVESQILLRAIVLEEESARAAKRAASVLPGVARSIVDLADRAREMTA